MFSFNFKNNYNRITNVLYCITEVLNEDTKTIKSKNKTAALLRPIMVELHTGDLLWLSLYCFEIFAG